ncbi:MAG TPA: tetratricopeptide repeat protein [Propionibacteriaceae bacterium]
MDHFPTGTVTFLFTDIEGSTQLWERAPETMKFALARHDMLLRRSIEQHDGYVFKTVGDAFCAAFSHAPDALSAALDAQRALRDEEWPSEIGAIRIRATLHTGAAEERGGDYFGPPLNRAARLLAAGHGDQTLLSRATQELVCNCLPPGVSLLDLGEHRLKDVFRLERVFQVCVYDLPAEFPPLRLLDAKLTNLPAQPTTFIGRERELAAVLALLRRDNVRLITLTGPGGTGKTRLSIQAAANVLDEYKHGVFFVPLATITDPDLVIPTIGAIFNLKDLGGQPVGELLKYYLAEKHLLLVLDNLEQVISAGPKIAALLSAAPRLRILVSSREKLHVYGEYEHPVPPLALPDMTKSPTLAVLSQCEAVALFIQRAEAANPKFQITEATAPAVAEICVRLDGLPLAIELAAARSKLLTPQAILERLSSRLKALTGGARDLPPRQQTIRGAIDWSYDLLDDGEKTLFARLGVFVGGWTYETAEAVCSDGLPMEVFDGLESLTDKSLIRPTEGKGSEPRFMMLQTLREYAADKLSETGELEFLQDRHLAYFVALGDHAERELVGPDQVAWLDRLEVEFDNVRAALSWSFANDREAGLRLVSALSRFWRVRGNYSDGSRWLSLLLSGPMPSVLPQIRAKALSLQGEIDSWLAKSIGYELAAEGLSVVQEIGDRHGEAYAQYVMGLSVLQHEQLSLARSHLSKSLILYQEFDDKLGLAHVLSAFGQVDDKDYLRSGRAQLEEGLALFRELGDLYGVRQCLIRLGQLAIRQGEFETARDWLEEGMALGWSLATRGIVHDIIQLGDLAFWQGSYEKARAYYDESLALAQETGEIWANSWILVRLGYVSLRQGHPEQARALFDKCQKLFVEEDLKIGVAFTLEGLASLSVVDGRPDRAAEVFAWADVVRETVGNFRPPIEQAAVDRYLATIRSQISDTAFADAQARGRAMAMDMAIARALGR